jgi:uroporphyrinogen-III decarboxylase
MNSRERVRAAMEHKPVDRVPVMCQLALGHYFVNSEYKPSDIWFDSETFARVLVEFQQQYGFDGILVNLPGRPSYWRDFLKSNESIEKGERLTWKNGLMTFLPADDNPQTYMDKSLSLPRTDYLTVNPTDPKTYRIPGYVWNTWHAPDLWDVGMDANLSDPDNYPAWYNLALQKARAWGPEISVHAEVFSPFTHLMELFGYEQALMALLDAPSKCHEMLSIFAGHVMAQARCYAACDPDALNVSSAFAGAGFISQDMYREFVVPYEQQVVQIVHEYKLPVYVHTCGAIGDRLDLMANSGYDGIDTLDPPPLGTVDLAEAKEKFGKRFFFKGNLDAVNEMLHADDATFEKAVRERLEIGKPGSGYILSSACSVAPHVEPQRLKAMVSLAEKYGRF